MSRGGDLIDGILELSYSVHGGFGGTIWLTIFIGRSRCRFWEQMILGNSSVNIRMNALISGKKLSWYSLFHKYRCSSKNPYSADVLDTGCSNRHYSRNHLFLAQLIYQKYYETSDDCQKGLIGPYGFKATFMDSIVTSNQIRCPYDNSSRKVPNG